MPLAEIAALADTVYVSFHKGLGALAGAALAGDDATIAAARTWIARAGGVLFRAYPYTIAAREGLRTELPRMPQYHARAAELREVVGIALSADPPACNIVAFTHLSRTANPRTSFFELTVEAGTMELDVVEIRDTVAAVVAAAR